MQTKHVCNMLQCYVETKEFIPELDFPQLSEHLLCIYEEEEVQKLWKKSPISTQSLNNYKTIFEVRKHWKKRRSLLRH